MEQSLEVLLSHLLRALQKPQDRNQFCQRGFLHLSQALDGKTLAVPNNLLNIHRRANSPNTTSDTSEVLKPWLRCCYEPDLNVSPSKHLRVLVAGSWCQIPC